MGDTGMTHLTGHSQRSSLIELIETGALPLENIDAALQQADVRPKGAAWLQFINMLLLSLGGLAIAFSVMFFVAYNWDDIGKFTQFGLVELFIVGSVFGFWKIGVDKLGGKISLIAGAILVGVLMALHGQTYQTGADPWQLFFNWSLVAIPWVLVARFPALWVAWLGLINLTLMLYVQETHMWLFLEGHVLGWSLFAINTSALIAWEFLAHRWQWLQERWALRIVGFASGAPLTMLVVSSIFEPASIDSVSVIFWLAGLGSLYYFYAKHIQDLFMLAGACLSVIVVLVSFLGWLFLDDLSEIGLLIISMSIIASGAASAFWLRRVQQEWRK